LLEAGPDGLIPCAILTIASTTSWSTVLAVKPWMKSPSILM
jgi:hypothetical protein